MSTRALNWVWELDDLGPSETLVLLALADQANDAGLAWPAQGSLARRSRQTDRNVRRVLVKLERMGLLSVERRSSVRGRRSNRYRLHIGTHLGESLELRQEDNLSGCGETGRDASARELSDDPVSVGTAARGQSVRLRKRTICPVAQPDTSVLPQPDTGVRLLPVKEPPLEPPDLTRPGEVTSPADPVPGRVGSGQAGEDQGPSSPGPRSGGDETPGGAPPGGAPGHPPRGAPSPGTTSERRSQAPGAAEQPSDVGRERSGRKRPSESLPAPQGVQAVLAACLPEHLRGLDASGARRVAGLLDERLAAGWRPAEIRALMDQPLPERTGRLSSLVAYRLSSNVDPGLAPVRVDGRRAEARRQEAARRRSEELAGTGRDRDPVREAAEAAAWERARREAPGASRLGLAQRVNEILAEDGGDGCGGRQPGAAGGSPGRGGRSGGRRVS